MKFLDPARHGHDISSPAEEPVDSTAPLLKTFGWVSAGVGVLAISLYFGREIRQRYKFKRRTPYDRYAHSNDDHAFGLGI